MVAITPPDPRERVEESIRLIAARQHGLFTRTQAEESGATDAHLKHGVAKGRYRRERRGIYAVAGAPDTWERSLVGACLGRALPTVASHRAAARLWRMPGFRTALVEVTTSGDIRPKGDIRVHRVSSIAACDHTVLDGVPITTQSRTILDLAAVVDEETLGIALDDALRRGLTSIPRLWWRLREVGGPGKAGSHILAAVLHERTASRAVAESPLETRVIRAIRGAGLPEPVRQHIVRLPDGTTARVDLAYPTHRIAIEVDGYAFHSGRVQWERLRRRNALQAEHWTVLNVTARQLRDLVPFVRQLASLLPPAIPLFGGKPAR